MGLPVDAVVVGCAGPVWTAVGFTVVAAVVFSVALMAELVVLLVVFPTALVGDTGGRFLVGLVGIGGFLIIMGFLIVCFFIVGALDVAFAVVVGTGVVVGFLLMTNSSNRKRQTLKTLFFNSSQTLIESTLLSTMRGISYNFPPKYCFKRKTR